VDAGVSMTTESGKICEGCKTQSNEVCPDGYCRKCGKTAGPFYGGGIDFYNDRIEIKDNFLGVTFVYPYEVARNTLAPVIAK